MKSNNLFIVDSKEESQTLFSVGNKDVKFGENGFIVWFEIKKRSEFRHLININYIYKNFDMIELECLEIDTSDGCFDYYEKMLNDKIIENNKIYDMNDTKFIKLID